MIKRKYGWRPDRYDRRDKNYSIPRHLTLSQLPPLVDLRQQCPIVWDQLQLGSCTSHSIGSAFQFEAMKQGVNYASMMPSRLFLYYNEREMEGTTFQDAGAEIRHGIKSIARDGICDETLWPYSDESEEGSPVFQKPPQVCYDDAIKHKAIAYYRVGQTVTELKCCLADGYPIAFGIALYPSFEGDGVAATGIVPSPSPDESSIGGHAILIVGYDDSRKVFIVRNSWGESWGDGGYCYFPYEYLLSSDASDFWIIRTLTS